VHTAIATSNIVTVAFALGMVATFCLTQNRSRMAGVLLTLRHRLEADSGPPVLDLRARPPQPHKSNVFRNRDGSLVAIGRHHSPTRQNSMVAKLLANNQRMFAPGAIDDFSTANPLHFQLVNLQVALFPILQNRSFAQVTAAVVFVALLSLWLPCSSPPSTSRSSRPGYSDFGVASSCLPPFYGCRFAARARGVGSERNDGRVEKVCACMPSAGVSISNPRRHDSP